MNLKQLSIEFVHLSYFFILVVLSNSLAFELAICITSIEETWMRARRRYKIREFNNDDIDYEWVIKFTIFWAWVRRRSIIAIKINNAWFDEKKKLRNERFLKEIENFSYIVFDRFCLTLDREMTSKISFNRDKN
jgi:hypothetical protein